MANTGSAIRRTSREAAHYWRSPLLPGGELLTATFHHHRFTLHWHDTFAFPVIEAGAQGYRYQGAQRVAGPGAIPAINPGEIHTGERAVEEGWVYLAFYPTAEFVRGLASDLAGRMVYMPWFPDEPIRDIDLGRRLAHAHRLLESGVERLAAETALTSAFGLLLSRHACAPPPLAALRADDRRVSVMKSLLAADLVLSLTLSHVAEAVKLSPFHALRLFSRTVGMPPHAWRNQLRLTRAVNLLRRGIVLSEAAAECGYADQAHFTRQFKRVYGVPPGQWRTA